MHQKILAVGKKRAAAVAVRLKNGETFQGRILAPLVERGAGEAADVDGRFSKPGDFSSVGGGEQAAAVLVQGVLQHDLELSGEGSFILAGCGGVSLWPFGSSGTELSRKPSDATEYQCAGGKVFYVRNLDANAVWLIAPDREIRLDKKAEGRYVFGRVELDIDKDRLDLIDPPTNRVNCKRAG